MRDLDAKSINCFVIIMMCLSLQRPYISFYYTNERLKHELDEYIEKADASEYQAKKISAQYKTLLESKEDEIKDLKEKLLEEVRQNKVTNEVAAVKLSVPSKRVATTSSTKISSSTISSDDGDWSDWGADNRKIDMGKGHYPPSTTTLVDLDRLKQELATCRELLNSKNEQELTSQTKFSETEKENDDLREKLYNAIKSEGLYIAEIKELKAVTEDINRDLINLKSENETFKGMLSDKNSDILGLLKQQTTSASSTMTATLNSEKSELAIELECKNFEISRLEKNIERLSLENSKLVKEIDTKINMKSHWCQTEDTPQLTLVSSKEQEKISAALLEENERLAKEKGGMIREIEVLSLEREEFIDELNLIKGKLLEAEDEIGVLEDENNALRDEMDEFERDRAFAKDDEITLGVPLAFQTSSASFDEYSDLLLRTNEYEFHNYLNSFKSCFPASAALKQQITSNSVQAALNDQQRQLEAAFKAQSSAMNEEIDRCKCTIKSFETEIETLQQKMSLAKDANALANSEILNLKHDLDEALKSNEVLEVKATQELGEKEKNIESLLAENDRKDQEISILTMQSAELTKKFLELQQVLNERDSTLKSLSENYEQMELKYNDLAREYEERGLIELKQQEEIRLLKTELIDIQKLYEISTLEKEEAKAQLIIVQQKSQLGHDELKSLRAELLSKGSEIERLQCEKDNYVKLNQQLELGIENLKIAYSEERIAAPTDVEKVDVLIQTAPDIETEEKLREIEKLWRENERLKSHLLEMEENYTSAAVCAENTENELQLRLKDVETMLHTLQNQLNENNVRYDSLQEKSNEFCKERDENGRKIDELNEQASNLKNQLKNVQSVLERIHKEKDQTETYELSASQNRISDLENTIAELTLKMKTDENELKKFQALSKSYTFLNQKLADRENALDDSRKLIGDKERMLELMKQKLIRLEEKQNSAVEREVLKNLFMSYLNAPTERQRIEIGFLMGKVLQFDRVEIEKLNLQSNQNWGWSSLWKSSGSDNTSMPLGGGKGLGDLFIQFLEQESVEKPVPKFDITSSSPPPTPNLHSTNTSAGNSTQLISTSIPLADVEFQSFTNTNTPIVKRD